jgi:hypothetical protein
VYQRRWSYTEEKGTEICKGVSWVYYLNLSHACIELNFPQDLTENGVEIISSKIPQAHTKARRIQYLTDQSLEVLLNIRGTGKDSRRIIPHEYQAKPALE